MKKLIIGIIAALAVAGCGVGSYSTAGGMDDEAAISVTSSQKKVIVTVVIDGTPKNVEAVYQQAFKSAKKNIKKTAQNTIYVPKGNHSVQVLQNGAEVYNKNILLGAGEHRVIAL